MVQPRDEIAVLAEFRRSVGFSFAAGRRKLQCVARCCFWNFAMPGNRFLLVLLIAVAVGGSVWWVSGFTRLMGSIFPGGGSPSTSMEPYDLVFKADPSAYSGGRTEEMRAPVEWRLTVPRAFVWSEIGDNDAVGAGANHRLHSVSLYMIPSPERQTFVPGSLTLTGPHTNGAEGFFIGPSNGIGASKIDPKEECNQDIRSRGGLCKDYYIRCTSIIAYKGWSVTLQMPRKYHLNEYKKYCSMVRDFLDDHVTHVDDIRPTNP